MQHDKGFTPACIAREPVCPSLEKGHTLLVLDEGSASLQNPTQDQSGVPPRSLAQIEGSALFKGIAQDKKKEKDAQRSINEAQFLAPSHAVGSQTILLVLSKTGNHLQSPEEK